MILEGVNILSSNAATHIRLVKDPGADQFPQEGFGKDLPGGLPVYNNPTLEGVESTMSDLDAQNDRIQLKRGAVAHIVSENRIYGERNLEQLAGRMNTAYSTVLDWQSTYRRLLRLSDERRIRVMNLDLRYSHFRTLNSVANDDDYEALLLRANKKKWSIGRLMDALHQSRSVGLDSPLSGTLENSVMIEPGTGIAPPPEPPEVSHYREEGQCEDDAPPMAAKLAPEELAAVGSDYERDVIERFCDWLMDQGISLVDSQGEVLQNTPTVDRYAQSEL